MLLRQTMLGCKLKAPSPHLLVVAEVRPATIPSTLLDVIGEYSAQPERVVSEMCAHEKAAPRIRVVDIAVQLRQRGVHLVVTLADSYRAVAHTEMHDDRGQIVRERTIALAQPAQGMTHHDVRKEWKRRVRSGRRLQEGERETWIIEQRIDATVGETCFELAELRIRPTRENAQRELRVITREVLSRIGENHEAVTSVACLYPEGVRGSRGRCYTADGENRRDAITLALSIGDC